MKKPINKNVFIIAEAGVNHCGSLDMACEMVETAAHAGADAIKFQTFVSTNLATKNAPKSKYQRATTDGSESQLAMLQKLELSRQDHGVIESHCVKCGIEFMSTPFDSESVGFLDKHTGIKRLKLGSGSLTNGPVLLAAARTGRPIILSCGLATIEDIAGAVGLIAFGYMYPSDEPNSQKIQKVLNSQDAATVLEQRLSLLQCTTEYPAPFDEINLHSMETLSEEFGVSVGFSDHSRGIAAAIAAVALGAAIIEKHFTLSRTLSGPDHQASIEPSELADLITSVRQVEMALGSRIKSPTKAETENLITVRQSLVAARPIKKGEAFSPSNLAVKRPGDGISPMRFWDTLGMVAKRSFDADEKIEL